MSRVGSQGSLGLFFSAFHNPGLQERLDTANLQEDLRCLLCGRHRSGRSSILFHVAYKTACSGLAAVFLCKKARLELSPPLLPEGVHPDDPAFQSIHFKYVKDIQQLRQYGACLHLLTDPPGAILIDDVTDLMHSYKHEDSKAREAELIKALAFIVDAIDHWRASKGHRCDLVVTDVASDEGSSCASQYLINRWCPLTLSISGAPPQALSLQIAQGSQHLVAPQVAQLTCHFSLAHTYLHLEGISG